MLVSYILRIEKNSKIVLNSNNSVQELYPTGSSQAVYNLNGELIKQITKYRSKITTSDIIDVNNLQIGDTYQIHSLIRKSNDNTKQITFNMYLSNFKCTYDNNGAVNWELEFIEK